VTSRLTYVVVTPAHNEADNLRQLAESMRAQWLPPAEWLIVDNGSSDGSEETIAEITAANPWARGIFVPKEGSTPRGAPVVRAFHAGLRTLRSDVDVITKLDADVTFEPDFFARILAEFEKDPALGITGGICLERSGDGTWKRQVVTRGHVRGATRAYRAACLRDVLPLEERMGWDGIDEVKARVAGWTTRSLDDLPFKHHRPLGAREAPWEKWIVHGRMAHYMGYRTSYLVARTAYRSVREPRAVGMLWGFAGAVARREPKCPDVAVRAHLRREQRLRTLPSRVYERLGPLPNRGHDEAGAQS
jgi:biofilm PGA synthesis N-glycosyltransferase PgaC